MFLLATIFPTTSLAAELAVSKSSSFSSSDRDFSGGETIYVNIETSSDAPNRALNIRDNNYNLINTYSLNKNGNSFTSSLPAPSGDGLYSLEAHIWGSGSDVTSVKTIKVGNANNGSVNVTVHSSVNGSSSTNTTTNSESKTEQKQDSSVARTGDRTSPSPEEFFASPSPEVKIDKAQKNTKIGSVWVWSMLVDVFSFIWPF